MSQTAQPHASADTAPCELGEGPVWDARLARLYWVDISRGELHALDDSATSTTTWAFGGTVGFVCLTPDPDVVVVGRDATLVRLELSTRHQETLVALEPPGSGLRCNEGKPDPAGRLWVGTVPDGREGAPSSGSLYSMADDGVPRCELGNLGCSNGLAWDVDRGTFYFIDSLARRIDRYRWDRSSGRIDQRSVLASFPPGAGLPDGMCIDREGHLWVAFWDGGCVRQVSANTGETLQQVDFPATRITSCTFGGPGFTTLYVTSAAQGLSDSERAAQPAAGRIFTVADCGPGTPAHLYTARQAAHR